METGQRSLYKVCHTKWKKRVDQSQNLTTFVGFLNYSSRVELQLFLPIEQLPKALSCRSFTSPLSEEAKGTREIALPSQYPHQLPHITTTSSSTSHGLHGFVAVSSQVSPAGGARVAPQQGERRPLSFSLFLLHLNQLLFFPLEHSHTSCFTSPVTF